MSKVLSTKLKEDEVDRFAAMAEQQGKTKSRLLRCVVQGYLSSHSRVDRTPSIDGLLPTTSSEKHVPLEKTNVVNGLPLGQNPTSKDSLLVYRTDAKRRPETSAKSSTSGWWLLVAFLVGFSVKSQPSTAVDRSSAYTTQPPEADAYGLYTHEVANTIVYTSTPTPFWQTSSIKHAIRCRHGGLTESASKSTFAPRQSREN